MKFNVRNLLIGLVIVIVLAVVLLRGDQLVELVETMKKGAAIPLVAALCTQLGKYFSQSFCPDISFAGVPSMFLRSARLFFPRNARKEVP